VPGFLAGHPFGAWVHFLNHVSKPCRIRMTNGALECPMCQVEPAVWRGYTPFYSSEYRRMFCLVSEEHLESVREIDVWAQVKIGRAEPKKSPVVVRQIVWRTSPLPPSPERPAAVNLLPFLLRLWKDEDLLRWHVEGTRAAAPAVRDRSRVSLKPDDETALIRDCLPVSRGLTPLGDVLDGAPAENGRHRRPKS
jgi:hypothetical protein